MLNYEEQDAFRALARGELARRRMTIAQLAKEIGKSNNSTYQAIGRGLHEPTQRLIDEYLGLGFFDRLSCGATR